MHRIVFTSLLLLLLIFAGCDSNGDDMDQPSSELAIQTVPGLQTISTPDDRGSISLDVGDQRTFRIVRTVRSTGIPDVDTDVTGEADFNFSNPDVAAMDSNGRLTALRSGFTVLEVVYRDDDNNPTDDDEVRLDITVVP